MNIIGTEANSNDPHNPPIVTKEIVSALNHEAFATKYMPNLGYNAKGSHAFHWKLQGWKTLEKRVTSPEFDCGGYKWRILLFPFGNSGTPQDEIVSVYLDCPNSNLGWGWHACAQFMLVISNPHDPAIYTVCYAHHRFTAEVYDWGFIRFGESHKLFQPQLGHNRPTIEEGSAVVSVYVRVLDDPTGVLWRNLANYDSKKETGYVGLNTCGATDYMSTVLQCLFCTNYFRKAVYQIPTEDRRPTESIPLALQRLFYNLQVSDRPVDTIELAKSLGWKPSDFLVRRDVEEFNRELQDKLDSLMKGTRAEGTIPKLFVGKMKSFVKCVNIDYESSKIEEFNEVELNVKGIRTLYDSFQDYVAVETLDGESKYQAEGFGLQDAWKGIIFQSFPPVLHLQLKRYEYDIQRDAMVKINDRLEFPFEIDLDEFLDETADRTKLWKYKLHSVLVHSGDTHNGLYFAFIKPDRNDRWLKFNDRFVTPVTDREVLEGSYGGGPLNCAVSRTPWDRAKAMKGLTNARMLVYIRETAIDEVLAPLTRGDIPPHLIQRLNEERTQMEARKKEREEQHLFLTIKVITDETFALHEGFDLASFGEGNSPVSDLPTFRVLKLETYSVFKSRVAQRFHLPENIIRLWVFVQRQNKTVRPDKPIPEDEPSLTVEAIRDNMTTRLWDDLRLYLGILPDPSSIRLSARTIVIFLKYFDATRQSLTGSAEIYIRRTSKVRNLIPIINRRMRWPSETLLKLYVEIKPGMIELMNPERTFAQSEMQDGDIVCFHVDIPDNEVDALESRGLYSNPQQFYNFLQNRLAERERDKRKGSC